MATKSFLKGVSVKSRKGAERLIKALENAEKVRGQEVSLNRSAVEVRREDVKDFVTKINWAG